MNALVLDASRRTARVQSLPMPTPQRDEVLIKVHAVALNPIDALYVFNPIGATGRVIGSDFAGTVVASNGNASKALLLPGTRVAGFLQGACSINDRPGAFAEYLACPADLVWRVPDSMSLQDAAGISLCGLTAAQALFSRLGLQAPFVWHGSQSTRTPASVFIYGASTSIGLYAAQLVRLSAAASGKPIKLVGAASPGRFDLLYAAPYAYDSLVDYRDPHWSQRVKAICEGGVGCALDCISEGWTVRDVACTLAPDGRLAIVRSREYGAWNPDGLATGVSPMYGAVWEGLGEQVEYNGKILVASAEARQFTVEFYSWLSGGTCIEANPTRVMPGGLDNIVSDAFTLLGTGDMNDRGKTHREPWMKPISAEKLIYRLDT